jgi:hypothetical protein
VHSKFHTKAGIPSGHTKRAYHGAYQEVYSMWHIVGHSKRVSPWGIPMEEYQDGKPCVYTMFYIPRCIPSGHIMGVYQAVHSMFYTKASIPSGHTKRAYHGACQEVYSMWHTAGHTKSEWPWGIPRGIPRGHTDGGIPRGHSMCVYNVVYSMVHTKGAYQVGIPSVYTK